MQTGRAVALTTGEPGDGRTRKGPVGMREFVIKAADRETGKDVTLVVPADTSSDAGLWASQHGYLVSSIKPVPVEGEQTKPIVAEDQTGRRTTEPPDWDRLERTITRGVFAGGMRIRIFFLGFVLFLLLIVWRLGGF